MLQLIIFSGAEPPKLLLFFQKYISLKRRRSYFLNYATNIFLSKTLHIFSKILFLKSTLILKYFDKNEALQWVLRCFEFFKWSLGHWKILEKRFCQTVSGKRDILKFFSKNRPWLNKGGRQQTPATVSPPSRAGSVSENGSEIKNRGVFWNGKKLTIQKCWY